MTTRFDAEAATRALVPINRLPIDVQTELLRHCTLLPVYAGQIVYTQGHLDDFVHYLLDGEAELLWNGKAVQRLAGASKAARRALDPPGRKRYTVRAVTHSTVARLERAEVDRCLDQASLTGNAKALEVSEIATEKSSNWMIRMLQSELFANLPATNIQRIFGCMEEIVVKADEVIVKQGQAGDYYYVIEQGYCEVMREIAGGRKDIHLADLGPGDAFGEAALIADAPRDATVTMLSDGRLMRLHKVDFQELIREPLLHQVNAVDAVEACNCGTQWLDIRYPEESAKRPLRNSRNIPLNVLRIQMSRLSKDDTYIVCSEDPRQSAVGAFLLVERGFQARFLALRVSEFIDEHPSLALQSRSADAGANKVIAFPQAGAETPAVRVSTNEVAPMEDKLQVVNALENTIDKIDRLYQEKEAEEAMHARVPVEAYADTHTGRSLADLIDEMEERHESLEDVGAMADAKVSLTDIKAAAPDFIDLNPFEAPPPQLAETTSMSKVVAIDTHQPMPLSSSSQLVMNASNPPQIDELTQILGDFEHRVRGFVDAAVIERGMDIERRYQDKIKRIRQLAAVEVRNREAILKQRYELHYRKKELALRAHYKKLMALANKISQQKAQLQQARKQFEEKLQAANALYKQVEDMRKLLREHLGGLDARLPLEPQRGVGS